MGEILSCFLEINFCVQRMPLNIILNLGFLNKPLHNLSSQIFSFSYKNISEFQWIPAYVSSASSTPLFSFAPYSLCTDLGIVPLHAFPPFQHFPSLNHQKWLNPSVFFWISFFSFLLHSVLTLPSELNLSLCKCYNSLVSFVYLLCFLSPLELKKTQKNLCFWLKISHGPSLHLLFPWFLLAVCFPQKKDSGWWICFCLCIWNYFS